MRIAVLGYYGFGNLGDEAVLWAMRTHLAERLPNAKLCVLSGDPEGTQAMHGVDAVHRGDLRAVAKAFRSADLVCSGGGSLFQDVTSWRSPVVYAALHELSRLARHTLVYAQGVGPLRRPLSRWLTRRAMDAAERITLRDGDSAALLRRLGIRRPIEVTCDPVFGLQAPSRGPEPRTLLIGVSVRSWPGVWLGPLARGLQEAQRQTGARVKVVCLHPRADLEVSRQLVERLEPADLVVPGGPAEALETMDDVTLLVGMRLHALILAAVCGRPFVALAYDPKVTVLARTLGAPVLPPDEGLTGEAVSRAVVSVWRDPEAAPRTAAQAARMRPLARRPAEVAAELLGV
ncbi:MAG: polysaccharide pyruvyl transferase CsaB [Armatimonadota bacterium]|nr:polysaccharide pyruvyl transferase CsaB [Armatimonadota bacterium]